ncbi:hypothetical protein [Paractinoplanes maris]|uniref:hypothetical protein n=1 Tax=Paractinoplanes maris TaxID=1734446 RepID=UPI0020227970|nr:hypothetical protein [Actinoplanes maris]
MRRPLVDAAAYPPGSQRPSGRLAAHPAPPTRPARSAHPAGSQCPPGPAHSAGSPCPPGPAHPAGS